MSNFINSYYEKFDDGTVKCIDEEIPFEIPQGWEWCRFSSIYWQLTDGVHSTPQYTEAGIPFLSVKNISSGKLSLVNTKFISEDEHKLLSRRCNPQKGDLLISKVGTTGIPLIIDIDKPFSIFVSLALIKFFSKYIDSDFLVHLIESPLIQEQVRNNTRGVGNKNWVLTAIANTLLLVPPLEEQKRIVAKLNKIQSCIDKYKGAQNKLKILNNKIGDKLRQSILQEAIQGKLVLQIGYEGTAQELLEQIQKEKRRLVKEGKLKKSTLNNSVIFKGDDNKYYERIGKQVIDITAEVPFEIPQNWQWVRLKDVVMINPRNVMDDNVEVGFIPMANIEAGYKSEYSYTRKKWGNVKSGFTHLADGDVAFAKITPCFQNRKSMFISKLPNSYAVGTTELIVLRPYPETITAEYILWFCKSSYFIEEATMKGTAGQQRVKVNYTPNKLFPLPPIKEQKRITARICQLLNVLK